MLITESSIVDNGAPNGAGISSLAVLTPLPIDLDVIKSTISGNTATSDGAGFNIVSGAPGGGPNVVDVWNSTISGNTATAAGGGGFRVDNAVGGAFVTLGYNTITGNSAGGAGGGILLLGPPIAGGITAGGTSTP